MVSTQGTRALLAVALGACCAAIIFIGAIESAQEQVRPPARFLRRVHGPVCRYGRLSPGRPQGKTELEWQTPWLSKHANVRDCALLLRAAR